MKMQHIPFATTDWAAVPKVEKSAQAGQAFWRTYLDPGAPRRQAMNPSVIREILKVTESPASSALAGGLPSPQDLSRSPSLPRPAPRCC
jgi:hypothetical protein